jgi:hypothetical protein
MKLMRDGASLVQRELYFAQETLHKVVVALVCGDTPSGGMGMGEVAHFL